VGPFALRLSPPSILFVDEVFSGLENLSNNVASAKTSRQRRNYVPSSVYFVGETVVSEISKTLVCSALNFNEHASSEF